MLVTIDIPDNLIEKLSRWASVQRTLDESNRLLDDLCPDDDYYLDRVNHNQDELQNIGPALDAVHQLIRNQIWLQLKSGEDIYETH